MKIFNSIVVPTDFSELSNKVAFEAAEFCYQLQANLILLHVVGTHGIYGNYSAEIPYVGLENDLKLYAQKNIKDLKEKIQKKIELKVCSHVQVGFTAEKICDFSKEKNADLIMMATHGKKGVSRLLLGSIAEKVVRFSEVPVLTLKPSLK